MAASMPPTPIADADREPRPGDLRFTVEYAAAVLVEADAVVKCLLAAVAARQQACLRPGCRLLAQRLQARGQAERALSRLLVA